MSAFQDFGNLTERRKAGGQLRMKRRIMIASITSFAVLLVCISAAVYAYHYNTSDNSSANGHHGSITPKDLPESSKTIKLLCSSTDYKNACESSLSKAVNRTGSGISGTNDIIKLAVRVIVDEIGKAFNGSKAIKSADPMVKGAIEDCMGLLKDAEDELQAALHNLGGNDIQSIPDRSHNLRTWLSAVMSYQQTCIDGFPEGELKSKMEGGMKKAKELTSNALAIIGEASRLLSMLDIQGINRRLLTTAGHGVGDGSHLPSWMSDMDRRLLRQKSKISLTPNVTVAKDGSGNFTTINDALANMPKEYEGRYVIYVKAGTYDEQVTVTKKMVNVTMYGDGSRKTVVTGNKNFVDGTRTFQTATFAALGDGFIAKAMGFQNTAGAIKHQAVALRVQSDRSIFLNCRMDGYQDTLYTQTHRQTTIMESKIGSFINPDGWLPWDGEFGLKTLTYNEYANKGPGANVQARVPWPGRKVITKEEAERFTVGNFIQGGDWIGATGTPVHLGLFN
ncbi:putative pectinesterase/pectinesterase inhibitor 21 [Acorus calamus]|uniref:Pectinesterase/pectinesterase inhibitor 21 n=1 Tax=Acorus calamus TaxID=4465 RepID=A0AAV9E780_ACOCL|nr:putative pectinesterase/pectinesterase inhibitor 21 [Acorus calamus]